MATTWNPADKSTQITLSNGNLTAAVNAPPTGWAGVRAFANLTSGKWYWEIVPNASTAGAVLMGIATSSITLNVGINGGSSTGSACFQTGGASTARTFVDGTVIGVNWGTGTGIGQTICFAYDVAAKLLWVRVNAGNWNNAAGNNPTTGVGGLALTQTSGYPIYQGNQSADSIIANFGATAFAQTPPSGFLTIPTQAQLTQEALEQWGQGTPRAQATQVALEMWGPGGTTQRLAVATQVALEQWAAVQAAAIAAQQGRVMILA